VKLSVILLLALLMLAVLNAGCVGFIRDTYQNYTSSPSPTPSITPKATLTPINETVERQYMFTEMLTAGIEHYNDGIGAANASKMAADRMDWVNATRDIELAKAHMKEACQDFVGMKPYAMTPDEIMLSLKWNETAYYEARAYEYVNLSYQEGAYQASRSFAEQNPVKYNYYVGQANYYLSLAGQSRAEAEELERRTFIGQQWQAV
jgi:hypothetical protein